ncbi:MAG: LamG domain-containing protein [Minicystis sp.]
MTAQGPTYPGSGDWTVEAWLRYPATSGQFIVVEQSDGLHPTDPDLGLVYRLAISDGDATFWMRLPGNNTIVDGVDVSAHAGQWFHAAVVYRGGAAMDFYVNGVLAGHNTIISSPIVSAPQGQVYLGGDRCGTSAGLALDEVRLSNVARY